MSAHVLLNLLNELWKQINARLAGHFISCLQRFQIQKFKNTKFYFICHMTLRLL